LPAFSKIIENLFISQVKSQLGFRPNHDTSLAVMEMVDQITAAVEVLLRKNFIRDIILLTCQKQLILFIILYLDKLLHYGVHGVAHG